MRRATASGLKRVDGALPRRQRVERVAGFPFTLECLDDLDAAIDRLLAELPPDKGKGQAGDVAEVCPHFGVVWPAAIALSEQIRERLEASPTAAAACDVLELGCGLALPSMVARRLGARRVVATDRHPLVPHFLARNAAANGLTGIEYQPLDWRAAAPAELPKGFDLVVGSDLLYEPWQPGHLAHLLSRLLARSGARALIADPGRRHVDAFVDLAEGSGLQCDLAAVRAVAHGGSAVEVLILEVVAIGSDLP